MNDLTLYSMPSSGNSFKVRLLLSLLDQPYTHVALEDGSAELAAAHENSDLPMGKLPVLVLANGTTLPESNAILHYLAEDTNWLPSEPLPRARVLGWMFFEQNRHETVIAVRAALRMYPNRARLATPDRMQELLEAGNSVLQVMEDRLAGRDWLEGDEPTIADISLYAYTHTAEERGGFDMSQFPAINAWLGRIAALPGYIGLFDQP